MTSELANRDGRHTLLQSLPRPHALTGGKTVTTVPRPSHERKRWSLRTMSDLDRQSDNSHTETLVLQGHPPSNDPINSAESTKLLHDFSRLSASSHGPSRHIAKPSDIQRISLTASLSQLRPSDPRLSSELPKVQRRAQSTVSIPATSPKTVYYISPTFATSRQTPTIVSAKRTVALSLATVEPEILLLDHDEPPTYQHCTTLINQLPTKIPSPFRSRSSTPLTSASHPAATSRSNVKSNSSAQTSGLRSISPIGLRASGSPNTTHLSIRWTGSDLSHTDNSGSSKVDAQTQRPVKRRRFSHVELRRTFFARPPISEIIDVDVDADHLFNVKPTAENDCGSTSPEKIRCMDEHMPVSPPVSRASSVSASLRQRRRNVSRDPDGCDEAEILTNSERDPSFREATRASSELIRDRASVSGPTESVPRTPTPTRAGPTVLPECDLQINVNDVGSGSESDSSVEINQQHLGFRSPAQPLKKGVDPSTVFIGGATEFPNVFDYTIGIDEFGEEYISPSVETSSFFDIPRQSFSPLEPAALITRPPSASTSSVNPLNYDDPASPPGGLGEASHSDHRLNTIDPTLLSGQNVMITQKRKERSPPLFVPPTHNYQTRGPDKRHAPRGFQDFVSTDNSIFNLENSHRQPVYEDANKSQSVNLPVDDQNQITAELPIEKIRVSKELKEKFCHQCRRKKSVYLHCNSITPKGPCGLVYCVVCINLRYSDYNMGEPPHAMAICFRCAGRCNCDICCRKAGIPYQPRPRSENMLAVDARQPHKSSPSGPKRIRRKIDLADQSDGVIEYTTLRPIKRRQSPIIAVPRQAYGLVYNLDGSVMVPSPSPQLQKNRFVGMPRIPLLQHSKATEPQHYSAPQPGKRRIVGLPPPISLPFLEQTRREFRKFVPKVSKSSLPFSSPLTTDDEENEDSWACPAEGQCVVVGLDTPTRRTVAALAAIGADT